MPLYVDECTTRQSRIVYGRLKIEMNASQEAPSTVIVIGVNGISFEQKIEYEWWPVICKKCKRVGHVCEPPPKKMVQKWVLKTHTPIHVEPIIHITPIMQSLEVSSDHEGAWVLATKIARDNTNCKHSMVQRSHFELFLKIVEDGTIVPEVLNESDHLEHKGSE